MSFFTKQFVDVIQWTETDPDVLAFRYPMEGMEIQNGAQLVVRESQQVLFFDEGTFADRFGPGTYTLDTRTLPILTYLRNWDKAFESPFKSDVYYFNLREHIDLKWGTSQPLTVRDREFGPLRIRAFGNYAYRINNIEVFWQKLCGTAEKRLSSEIEGQLRASIITALASGIGKGDIAFVDMAGHQEELARTMGESVAPAFANYGLQLTNFALLSLTLPEDLEKHLDRATSMRMVGDLGKYTQFQVADSVSQFAAGSDGTAAAGAGIGAGLALGQAMVQGLGGAAKPEHQADGATADDVISLIDRLGDLFQKGVLTQEEFNAKKAELLAKLK